MQQTNKLDNKRPKSFGKGCTGWPHMTDRPTDGKTDTVNIGNNSLHLTQPKNRFIMWPIQDQLTKAKKRLVLEALSLHYVFTKPTIKIAIVIKSKASVYYLTKYTINTRKEPWHTSVSSIRWATFSKHSLPVLSNVSTQSINGRSSRWTQTIKAHLEDTA